MQNWPNLEKSLPFHHLSSKLSYIFFFCVKDLTNREAYFLAKMGRMKMDDPFQRPLWPISIILSKVGTILKSDN